jgi:hypothetical protein
MILITMKKISLRIFSNKAVSAFWKSTVGTPCMIVASLFILGTGFSGKILHYLAGLLALSIALAACGKEKEGAIPFASCSCWTKNAIDTWNLSALFLKDADPDQIYHDAIDQVARIVYYSKQDTAYVYQRTDKHLYTINQICNFPEFAKQWTSGTTVYLEGTRYQPCNPPGGIATVSYFDLILTKLIISK